METNTATQTPLKLTADEILFLRNGLDPNETREYMRYVSSRRGRALTTNGHVAYMVEGADGVSEKYEAFECGTGAPVACKVPAMDRLLDDTRATAKTEFFINVNALELVAAAAQGINKKLERDWKRTPKKTRSASTPNAGVQFRGGEYGVYAEIRKNDIVLRNKVSDASTKEFAIEVDADYLTDALEALVDVGVHLQITMRVGREMDPVWLDHAKDSPFRVLIMPRRM